MKISHLLVIAAFVTATTVGAQTVTEQQAEAPATGNQTFAVDKTHADVGFKVKHLVISNVRGNFTDFDANLELDADNKLVSADATIKVDSIDTNNEKRDAHLKGEDFFDAANHPDITFVSKSVETRGGTEVIVADFTIRGVTKELVLPYKIQGPVNDPWGNTKIALQASTTINRTDYGLTWNAALETGGVVVGEDVELNIDVEFAKQ